jgi:hypothetical protein
MVIRHKSLITYMTDSDSGGSATCSSDILNLDNEQYTLIGCGNIPGATYYALPTSISAKTTASQPSTLSTPSASSISSSSLASVAPMTATTGPTAAPSLTSNGGGTNTTVIIAGVVGSVLAATALICVTVIVIFFLRKKSAKKADTTGAVPAPVYEDVTDEKAKKVEAPLNYGYDMYAMEPVELEAGQAELAASHVVRPPMEMGISSPH